LGLVMVEMPCFLSFVQNCVIGTTNPWVYGEYVNEVALELCILQDMKGLSSIMPCGA
jgi:hypothetical protein